MAPFAKLTEGWPFSNQLQEIDLCVHAMLGTARMESKSGGKNGDCLGLHSSQAVAPWERLTGCLVESERLWTCNIVSLKNQATSQNS